MKRLGINIDHVATLRNARGEGHPDVVDIAKIVKKAGANSITVHLREDRRHINDNDLKILCHKNFLINMEMAANLKMMKIAIRNKPNFACLVPEKRNEVTTEGGLNFKKNVNKIKSTINILNKHNIRTSLFINPTISDIKISKSINANCIELHTGRISNQIKNNKKYKPHLKKIITCAKYAKSLGLEVHAGHGMDYKTAKVLSQVKEIKEFNIGHFIIGESIIYGLKKTIRNFKNILK